jgi:hypothetical protein
MTRMANRVQALEEKAMSPVMRKIHLLGMTPHSTSEEAVAAFKQANPDTQEDEFIVMVGMSALADEEKG